MADLRKSLSKLKVVELKEKLQELGKIPKGLKADLVNQLAEVYESQQKSDIVGHSAPIQAYQTADNDSQHYYQQTVPQIAGQYAMAGQQVYEQTQPYIQTPYEQQYQYPTHTVFSPTHEQQYSQSSAPYQMTTPLSPRISAQLSPQMANQLTQQLSPQMAQQFRQGFQSPQTFPSNDAEPYPPEYVAQSAPEGMGHYGMSHIDMHSIQSQAPIPAIPPINVVHRAPVIEAYAPDIAQTQGLPPNIAPALNVYKRGNEAFIASHSMVAPQDMIDFDDLAVDPSNEPHYSQPMAPFGAEPNQTGFGISNNSVEYQRGLNEGQSYSQPIDGSNQLPELATDDTNDDSTDVDSNESNQSFSNEVQTTDPVKHMDTDFSVKHIMSSQGMVSQSVLMNANNLAEDPNQFNESSGDSVQTDVESVKDENQFVESNDEVIHSESDLIKTVQTFETDLNESHTFGTVEDNVYVKSEEQTVTEKVTEEVIQTPVVSAKPIVVQTIKSQEIPNKPLMTTSVAVVKEEVKKVESVQQNGIRIESNDKKISKNQKKKQRKKLRAKNRRQLEEEIQRKNSENADKMDIEEEEEQVEIEYIPEPIKKDPIYFQYIKVFDKFRTGETDRKNDTLEDEIIDPVKKMMERKKPVEMDLKDEDELVNGEQKVSKRKLKQMTRMTVSELKQRVSHPELVEMHDVTARDPLLLLHLKSTRNSVPVPRHWCYKRKYLQGKRGFEKPPFKLPEFIRKTGIMEMRQALQEKEESKSLKAQMREKIRPKMGKIDIDYQKLHDAFFKWQTKPKMTIHGDLYYEGKEFETRLKEKRPGELTSELRTSLGMPTGPNSQKCPPPWLIAMQRYGPPPSYPNIKIPGLNAPIPDGCSFGYHAGGWGKPPVDEYGRPLYGDVFGIAAPGDLNLIEEEVDRTVWGEMEDESEEEEESESEEEETEANATDKPVAKEVDETGFVTPAEGLITPSGLASIPTGMETPDMIELRKKKQIEAEMESADNPALFTVIPEKKTDKGGKEMMGSAHTYDMSAATLRKGQGVEVALDPSDLEAGAIDTAQMAVRYEQSMKERSHLSNKEDLSDMVAEHNARQKRKKPQEPNKSNKKYQFKF